MSRIGKIPISIPKGVEIKIKDNEIDVKGPKGLLSRNIHSTMKLKIESDKIIVYRPDDTKSSKSLHGMTRALINNMVVGVTDGFEKKLQIVGIGYRASLEGKGILLSLGYSHPSKVSEVDGIVFEVAKNNDISVKGIDKELVGQTAADIRSLRKPDPYKGKGIRYFDEVIVKKAGKTGSK